MADAQADKEMAKVFIMTVIPCLVIIVVAGLIKGGPEGSLIFPDEAQRADKPATTQPTERDSDNRAE
jgi:predicted small lipoprotein YifL